MSKLIAFFLAETPDKVEAFWAGVVVTLGLCGVAVGILALVLPSN